MKKIGLKILKWISFIVLGIVCLFVIVWTAIQIPSVQTYIVGKVTNTLSTKLQVPVKISRVNISFFKTIVLEGIYIQDKQKDTLLYAGKLKASIGLLSLTQHTINISSAGLENAYINIYRRQKDTAVNYAFIMQAFSSDTTKKDTTASSWKFDMSGVDLEKVRVKYYDYPSYTDVALAVEKLEVDIHTLGLEEKNTRIDGIDIDRVELTYNQIAGQAIKDTVEKKIQKDPPAIWKVGVGDITLSNSHIIFNNQNVAATYDPIDYNHLDLSSLQLKLSDLSIEGGDFGANIKKLAFSEHKGFKLNNLALAASLKNSKLHAELNQFKTPYSDVSDKLTVDISDVTKVGDLISEIKAQANFDESVISMHDVAVFAPNLDQYKDLNLKLTGDLKGKVGDLQFRNADLAFNDENYIRGNFDLKGLPDINKLIFDVDIEKIAAQGNYISKFVPKSSASHLKSLGNIDIKLSAKGDIHRFQTKATVQTSAGIAGYQLQVALDKKLLPSAVSGNIHTNHLHLGHLLGNPQLGQLTLQANLRSKGISSTYLSGNITSFEFNKYLYQDIHVEGNYIGKAGNVTLDIKDSNLVANIKGSFDQSTSVAVTNLEATMDADLYKLKLYASPLLMHTNLKLNSAGLNMDSIKADLMVTDFRLQTDTIKYTLDTLHAMMNHEKGFKSVKIISPLINADVHGNFSYEELPNAIEHLISHYMSSFKPKNKPVHLHDIAFDITLGNTKGITQIFMGGLSTVKDIHLGGSFAESDHLLKLNGQVGTINFGDQKVKNVLLTAEGDEDKLNLSLQSNTLYISQNVKFYNPSFKGSFSHDILHFNLGMKDTIAKSRSRLNMDGILALKGDSIDLKIPKLDLNLRGSEWKLPYQAEIAYATKYLKITGLSLTSGKQSISIATHNERSKNPSLNAGFQEVSIGELSKIFGLTYDLEGKINGKADVVNPMGPMIVEADLKFDSLTADKRNIGNLQLTAGKTATGPLKLNTTLSGATNNINIAGLYYMDRLDNNLDFKVNIENLNLNTIQPFAKDIFYDLRGNIKANFALKGSPALPDLTGALYFNGSNIIGISAIQTPYKIENQHITFNPNSIQLQNFIILDTVNKPAIINGFVYHENLSNYKLALNFNAKDFYFLDSKNSNNPVYGKFIADLKAKVEGPIDNLAVRFNVTTKPSSNLFLNVATQKTMSGTPEYISFYSFRHDTSGFNKYILDSSAVSKAPKMDLSRFKINGNITVTKDATFNIIINPQTGDQILARGDGNFKMNFDSNNDINLFGQYVIDNGSYNLSLLSMVKRNFKIDKGSTINFYGDPQAGEMDIAAIYTTKASRYDLISDQADMMTKEQISAAKRRLPVQLYLKLKGEFLKPEIAFDIKVPESGGSINNVEERMNQIRSDESELNKQAFGLLVMGKFLPYQGGSSSNSGGGGINESATETVGNLIADQLNKLGADYLNGVEIEVNTETQSNDNQVSSNVSVMANKQVSDRLKVGVGGKSNVNNQGAASGVSGEYNLMYQLNKEGNLNVKLFSTSQQNIYTGSNNQVSGFSINHNKNFNSFKEFFRK